MICEFGKKTTNTGLLLNYTANFSQNVKSGLIMCFFHRDKITCSKCKLYLQELNKLNVICQINAVQTCL